MLSLFNWNEGFLTHISSVDEQHRKLVELINDLGEMIFSSDTLDPLQFIPVRDTLFNYVHQHFVDEESIMAASRAGSAPLRTTYPGSPGLSRRGPGVGRYHQWLLYRRSPQIG